jgi:hypothetical protein
MRPQRRKAIINAHRATIRQLTLRPGLIAGPHLFDEDVMAD